MANLTEGDRKLITMAWKCFVNPPQVDYPKLQAMGKYKTPASATACYLAARKKMLSDDPAVKITDRDRELLVMAWQCFKAAPQVDYKKLKELGGYKTPASATACYLAARKKLLGGEGEDGTVSGRGRKRKGLVAAGDGDGGETETPKKRAKKGRKEPTAEIEEDDGEDATPVKREPEDDDVDTNLFTTAQQFLQSEEGEGVGAGGDWAKEWSTMS